jgi:cell wall-associated NlpC family hydrolase
MDSHEKVWDFAIAYGLKLKGASYCHWDGGYLNDCAPAWNSSSDPPPIEDVLKNGLSCSGLVNLMLRSLSLPVPRNHPWNGGTEAYWLNFKDKMITFDASFVRRGDAVFRKYNGFHDQGHIAVALNDGKSAKLLQCFAWNLDASLPGVNDSFTVEESHCGGYYTHIIRREDLWNVQKACL